VVNTENHVDIFHGLCSDIGKFLDLGSGVLDLFIVHREVELFNSGLDGVPSSQTVTIVSNGLESSQKRDLPDRDVSAHTEIGGVEDLVCRWVGEDSLGVNTGLVGECTESSNVVVAISQSWFQLAEDRAMDIQRNRDLDGFGDEVLDLSEHGEIVLGLDVFRVGDHHPGNETTEGCDTVSLSNTELIISLRP
jgi:hypothetical protein